MQYRRLVGAQSICLRSLGKLDALIPVVRVNRKTVSAQKESTVTQGQIYYLVLTGFGYVKL